MGREKLPREHEPPLASRGTDMSRLSTPFSTQLQSQRPPEEVRGLIFGQLNATMTGANYRIASQAESSVTFQRSYRPLWTMVPIVLLFPVGLLFLRVKRESTVTFHVQPADKGTKVVISGTAHPKLIAMFEDL